MDAPVALLQGGETLITIAHLGNQPAPPAKSHKSHALALYVLCFCKAFSLLTLLQPSRGTVWHGKGGIPPPCRPTFVSSRTNKGKIGVYAQALPVPRLLLRPLTWFGIADIQVVEGNELELFDRAAQMLDWAGCLGL